MAAITFESKMSADGKLTIPTEAVKQLGIRPGDDVRVRVEPAQEAGRTSEQEQEALQAKFDRFFAGMAHARFERPGTTPKGDEAEIAFVEEMDEKYRRLGFKP